MTRVLVVDDKEMMRDSVATTLARRGHTVVVASGGKAALDKIAERQPDVAITDLQMPEMDGLELLAEIRRVDEQLPVIFMTAYGSVETAVAALKQGAFDYVTKPFHGDELVAAVDRAIEHGRLLRENQVLRAAAAPRGHRAAEQEHQMIGDGPVMAALRQRLALIADSHGTVLISGESGAGKEVAARWIHEHSPRRDQPFLALNCAALSTSLLESELFGHEKGAFTGADKLRKGRFELADGGTLLLDEISEIAPAIQAKLLRVLQEHGFERVGSSMTKAVDVRVIATTNRNLASELATGGFRQDLYFRLNVLPLPMPALREHPEDLPSLCGHFLKRVGQREGRAVKCFDAEAEALLRHYPWPGNVRELQNICERAAVLTSGDIIDAQLIKPWLTRVAVAAPAPPPQRQLPWRGFDLAVPSTVPMIELDANVAAHLLGEHANGATTPPGAPPGAGASAGPSCPSVVCDGRLTLEEIERQTILATLQHNRGHRQRSAAALGIGVRTLGLKLKKWKELKLVEATV